MSSLTLQFELLKLTVMVSRVRPIDDAQSPIPDGASWITLEDGQHVLIGKDGKVIAGAGGKLDGKYYGTHGENSPNKTITKNYNEEMAGKNKPQDNLAQSEKGSKMESRSNEAGKPGETTVSTKIAYPKVDQTNGIGSNYNFSKHEEAKRLQKKQLKELASDFFKEEQKEKSFVLGLEGGGSYSFKANSPDMLIANIRNHEAGHYDKKIESISEAQNNLAQSAESSKMESRSNEDGKPGDTTMKAKEHKWNGTELEITVNDGPAQGVYKISPYKIKDGIIDLGPRTLLDNRTINLKMKTSDFPGIEKEAAEKIIELKAADEKEFNSEKRIKQEELDANMAKNGFYYDDYHGSRGEE